MRKTFIFFFVLIAVVLLTMVAAFLSRDYFLTKKINSTSAKFHENTGGYLTVKNASFTSMLNFQLSEIAVSDSLKQPVILIKNVSAKISLRKLLRLKTGFSEIEVTHITANLITDITGNNYHFILKRKSMVEQESVAPQANTYAKTLNQFFNNITELSKLKASIEDVVINLKRNSSNNVITIPALILDKGVFSMSFSDVVAYKNAQWNIKGKVNTEGNIDFVMNKSGNMQNNFLPFFNKQNAFNAGFNSLTASIQNIVNTDDHVSFDFIAGVDSLKLNHWRIASETVLFDSLQCNFKCIVSGSGFVIDSNSTFGLNRMNTYIGFELIKTHSLETSVNLSIKTTAPDFFNSLPAAMFPLLEGMQTKGDLIYKLNFSIDTARINNLVFNSSLSGKNFRIIKYGTAYFPKINQSFLYDAYDGDRFAKSFWVGTENIDFVPLQNIATNLQYAVLTSEDPSFFYHRGFVEEAFRESLKENIKAKRFARGGSTISMQLVKNIFLSREKNIARKLQEVLIVWLIENNNISSKERMFEIYLNVIEWGPNVYGIKQASEFYFDKQPSQLTLAESIFLASIIPRPKYFKYNFTKEGKLKPYLSGYYKLISNRMLFKTWITPLDTFNLEPQVLLKGRSLQMIVPNDSLKIDSLPPVDDFFN